MILPPIGRAEDLSNVEWIATLLSRAAPAHAFRPDRDMRQFDGSIVKETSLDEMEHSGWIVGTRLRGLYPELWF